MLANVIFKMKCSLIILGKYNSSNKIVFTIASIIYRHCFPIQVPQNIVSVSFQPHEEAAGDRQMLKGDLGLPDQSSIILTKRKNAPPSTQK